ncbi:MAG: IS4 family transposase [Phycisphaerae bacterium]|nr:IS4 family transposase [Phycisphaerae bacterium]
MNAGQTIFSQLMAFVPTYAFNRCVRRYRGDYRVRTFSCRDQCLAMAFAQLTYRESLRDIETCLRSMSHRLYHAGFRATVARSTLADANELRDWRIYADLAAVLIARARELYINDSFAVDLDQTVYAFDSTTIDLCLTLFPWAQFRRRKSAVKLHTLLDLRGNIPCFIHVSSGRMADVTSLDLLPIEAAAFYVMDRGYTDFGRLYRFTQGLAFFIIRAKRNLDFSRRTYRHVDKTTGLRSDQTIILRGPKTSVLYPDPLRRISYYAVDINKRFVFLTNNFSLDALTIAQLFKCRWQVELFFKWIKQHLRIKAFYGTSANAVKTQVWIAVCVYVLVAIVKKELNIDRAMGEILQILSISLFEKMPLLQAFSHAATKMGDTLIHNQLPLFDF